MTATEKELLAAEFEGHRAHLKSVAYRMLGSISEADDAVQEAWLRLSRSRANEIDNLRGWLRTVVTRLCLDALRSRKASREVPLDTQMPDPMVTFDPAPDPEEEAIRADSVGLALLVVLETLSPAERLAYVLHDMFAIPFDDIAEIVRRTPEATRKLASRARQRVQGGAPVPDVDLKRQRQVVDAFFGAAREGDLDRLVAVLDPEVVLRSDGGSARPMASVVVRGARNVAEQAVMFSSLSPFVRPAIVNDVAGVVVAPGGKPFSVMAFTVREGRIVAIDVLADPERLEKLGLPL